MSRFIISKKWHPFQCDTCPQKQSTFTEKLNVVEPPAHAQNTKSKKNCMS